PFAFDIAPGQLAGPERQERQRVPDLALEMQRAVQQVVEESAERAVDVRLLPAGVAVRADQLGAAVEAGRLVGVPLPRRAVSRLDRAADQRAFRHAADRFGNVAHALTIRAIVSRPGPASQPFHAAAYRAHSKRAAPRGAAPWR